MAKKITGYIKLQVPAGIANPSPPIGPALGQRGVNIMEFCKAFNAATQELEKGAADPDGDHRLCRPQLLLRHQDPAGVLPPQEGGADQVGLEGAGQVSAGTIRRSQLAQIAEAKMKDLNANDIDAATKIIEGSARAMGLEVVEG